MAELKLPKEEYIHTKTQDGHVVTTCTMRQIVLHTIGLDDTGRVRHRPYTRHGKKYYRPWRNFFSTFPHSAPWPKLCKAGYAHHGKITKLTDGTESCTYWLTRAGLDWLGDELGITIYDEDD